MATPAIHDLDASGLAQRVLEWDGGGSRTVLLLHGYVDSAIGWSPVAERLAAAGHHVIAPDLRGWGASEHLGPGGIYHLLDYVPDVHAAVTALARPEAPLAVVGHSLGGAVAAYYAGSFPRRVARLALVETGALVDDPLETLPERVAAWVLAREEKHARRFASAEEAVARACAASPHASPAVVRAIVEAQLVPDAGGVRFSFDPRHLERAPVADRHLAVLRPFLAAIRCPVLLVSAAESTVEPRFAEMIAREHLLPDARHVVVEAAGHVLPRERPDELARLIVEHLAPRAPG